MKYWPKRVSQQVQPVKEVNKLFIISLIDPSFRKKAFSLVTSLSKTKFTPIMSSLVIRIIFADGKFLLGFHFLKYKTSLHESLLTR